MDHSEFIIGVGSRGEHPGLAKIWKSYPDFGQYLEGVPDFAKNWKGVPMFWPI